MSPISLNFDHRDFLMKLATYNLEKVIRELFSTLGGKKLFGFFISEPNDKMSFVNLKLLSGAGKQDNKP